MIASRLAVGRCLASVVRPDDEFRPVLGLLALAVLRLGSRFPRTGLGLIGGSLLVVLLTSGSELVLLTGLLSAVPVGVGLVRRWFLRRRYVESKRDYSRVTTSATLGP